jgi:hypothetical protein
MAPHVDEGVDEGSCTRTIVLACSDAHSHSLLVMPGIITARTRSFSVAAANGAPRALLVICWLSARLCPGIMIADMYWQFCAEWQDRLITVDSCWCSAGSCWLSAGYQRLPSSCCLRCCFVAEMLLFMELLFIIRPGAAVYGDAVYGAAVYNSPWCS